MHASRTIPLCTALLLTLSGCASIFNGSSHPVAIKSTPEGASYTITNRAGETIQSGTTPAQITLKSGAGYFKGETYQINFSKPGFAKQTTELNTSVSGWYWGNILLGGLIGMLAVDPVTGAMYKLPEEAEATLLAETALVPGQGELIVFSVEQLPSSLQGQLLPLR